MLRILTQNYLTGMQFIKALNKIKISAYAVCLCLVLLNISLHASAIYVGPNHPIKTIKEGLQNVQPGDSLIVDGGHYSEGNLIIQQTMVFTGINHPVLDGKSQFEILTISGKNIVVSGITFINCGKSATKDFASIKCIDAENIRIENNKIENSYFGIHISNTSQIHIKNNWIAGQAESEQTSGNGIHLWKCNHALIENNHISGHRDGIYFEFVTESSILHNYSTENVRYGLHFMFSHKDYYANNTFIKNGAGVAVMYSHEVTMESNHFENNWGASSYGILLKDISDSWINGNTFDQNTIGIHMEGSSRMVIEKNRFKENGWALKVQASCNDIQFQHNNFIGNTFDVATNGSNVLSRFSQNYWDKYEGYDRTKDGFGDIPYHPVSMYSMIVEQNPNALILLRSILIATLDKAEKAIPSLTPENLVDFQPKIIPNKL